jgi:catechol 2,3-dioxygenase-like lactoylglutathione lyase family enzyme
MSVMESRLSMLSLGVKDLEVSRRFYSKGLGFIEREQSNEFIVFYKLGALTLSLYPREKLAADAQAPANGEGFKGFTLSHNMRNDQEVNDLLSAAVLAGARLIKPACRADWGGYSGYFSDPDGFLWEIATGSFLDPE